VYPTRLSAADQAAYLKSLSSSYNLQVQILIMDMAQNVLADISDMLVDGQVNADKTAEVTRSASLTLFDKDRQLPFDSKSPTDGQLFYDRMIRIVYSTRSYEVFNQVVSIPIFTGPIVSMNRSGADVQLELMGKDHLAKKPAWRTKNYPIGSYRRSVIHELMTNVGETKLSLAEWAKKTANPYGVTRETDVWSLAKRMAAGMSFYYDGAGWLQLRPWMSRSIFTFATGRGGNILTEPEINYDIDDVYNIVLVKGATANGAARPVEATAYAPASHPLSAQSLGRNGYARHIPEIIEDGDLTTKAECQERADTQLAYRLAGTLNATFDAMPIPVLELDDVVQVKTTDYSFTFALDRFSLGLKAGASMSIGYVQRRSVQKAKIRGR